MRMFLGEYNPNITEGSRLALPKKLRYQINGDTVILSRGFEKCIFVYDKEDWVKEAQKQEESPISNKEMRDLKRYMYASAAEVDIDAQGRVVIPSKTLMADLKQGVKNHSSSNGSQRPLKAQPANFLIRSSWFCVR